MASLVQWGVRRPWARAFTERVEHILDFSHSPEGNGVSNGGGW
jgi:hypothetical protein